MNKKSKKILGIFSLLITLGFLSSCNSFCDNQDISSYCYGYDGIGYKYFDTKEDALDYINRKIPNKYEKYTFDTLTTLDVNGNTVNVIEKMSDYNLYYYKTCQLNVKSIEKDDKGKHKYYKLTIGKSDFLRSVEVSAQNQKFDIPYNAYFDEISKLTLDLIVNESINKSPIDKKTLTYKDLYGYTYQNYKDVQDKKTTPEELSTILKGGNINNENIVGRNNSLLVKYGHIKFQGKNDDEKFTNIINWNDMLSRKYGPSFVMGTDYFNLYKKELLNKVKTVKTCISTEEYGLYGHISKDPLNETVPITNKTPHGFFKSWGKVFKERGFLEGLLVYPIAYCVESLSHTFGMNGWGQIGAVLIITVFIRILIMLIGLPSTISTHKMNFLKPEIAKLQQKYPNYNSNTYEKQRYTQAQLALYKKHNVHPLSSMFMMFIQFPIFICVWNGLTGSASLSSDSVLGLYLSETIWGTLKNVGTFPPHAGWWTAFILIIILSLLQIIQVQLPQFLNKKRLQSVSKTVVSNDQDQSEKQMRMVTWVMTLFIIFMGFSLPSAMAVYWTFGAILQIIQTIVIQIVITKKIKEKK